MTRWMLVWVTSLLTAAVQADLQYFSRIDSEEWIDPDYSIIVTGFPDASSAREAGLRVGDRVVGVQGMRVRSMAELSLLKAITPITHSVVVTVSRGGQTQDIIERGVTSPQSPIEC